MSDRVKQRAFLAAYAKLGNITAAATAAKVGRRSHLRWLEEPEYAAAFAEAKEEACELLEAEARRRAVEGVEEPVVYQGQIQYSGTGKAKKPVTIRRYSDTLLIFLMKGAMPEKYRDNVRVEHTGELQLITERLAAGRARLNDAGKDEH